VGNPFSLGPIGKGDSVLDIGCGAGVDTLVAAALTGPDGRATGVDLTPEMLEAARAHLQRAPVSNVVFQQASAEALPFPDESFDEVISNGVFNLVPDKPRALNEVFRVLKPLGGFMIADQVPTVEAEKDGRTSIDNWAG
jgi:ubiquinone/menaquinone biosynthesis C-methylase UbiE